MAVPYLICTKNKQKKIKLDNAVALSKAKETHANYVEAAVDVLNTEKDPTKWSNKQLNTMLKPLKRKDDGAMPTKKAKMLECYLAWKDRDVPLFDDVSADNGQEVMDNMQHAGVDDVDNEQELTAEEEAISTMMEMGAVELV